eukprot:TRINITY_DN43287_c0_g1_i1.p1 TRINITY_DN43287_c0_g1~~TRINITY_DN43287_c0_g1_i1.p1  ORF type:complete len:420 (+),score=48.33 TRINITY_DN43287_c0_g1_i1:52-1311(+)
MLFRDQTRVELPPCCRRQLFRPFFLFLYVAVVDCMQFVTTGWTDPSPDVHPNLACQTPVTPLIEHPANVTELHPAHLKYVLAVGDSLTAAALAGNAPGEYRARSWSAGRGSPDQYTMPYILRKYSPDIVGDSWGPYHLVQLAPCCGPPPYWTKFQANRNQLNAALSGARSSDWKVEIDHLTRLISGGGYGPVIFGGFPRWNLEQQAHYKNNWKVMTVFLGMNDVLTNLDVCSENPEKRQGIVKSFNETMTALFEHLVLDPDDVFKKLYVNLGMLFRTTLMGKEALKHGWCKLSSKSIFSREFACMHAPGNDTVNAHRVDEITSQMNMLLRKLAAKYDQRRPDFGINLVQAFENQQVSHRDLRSSLDCFHPTKKAQRVLGVALWNSMLAQTPPTPIDKLANTPTCALPQTRLSTYTSART